MCLTVAEAMLSAQPEKSRVCIAVPTDLARYSPGLPRTVPGNYTGSLIVQLRRGAPLQSQITRQFGWFRRGHRLLAPPARRCLFPQRAEVLKQSCPHCVASRPPARAVSELFLHGDEPRCCHASRRLGNRVRYRHHQNPNHFLHRRHI